MTLWVPSERFTLNAHVPVLVGVPEITPEGDMLNPGGSADPALLFKVHVAVLPAATVPWRLVL